MKFSSYSCAAVDKISTDIGCRAVPLLSLLSTKYYRQDHFTKISSWRIWYLLVFYEIQNVLGSKNEVIKVDSPKKLQHWVT